MCFTLRIKTSGENMIDNIRFIFVYPNGDEVECITEAGRYLDEVAIENGVNLDRNILPTCKVLIQVPTDSDGFAMSKAQEATAQEMEAFGENETETGYRYAHTYLVTKELSGANVFLNIIRVQYVDKNNQEHNLTAILNENFMPLRDRNSAKIDLSFSCRGGLACATCHCIMVSCQEEPSEDEVDLLQYSDGFCDQSRLGCQVKLTAQRDTQVIRNPKARTG